MSNETSLSVPRVYPAALVLGAILAVYAIFLWVLFSSGSIGLPVSLFLFGLFVTVLFVGGLIVTKRWNAVWRWTFSPMVGVPAWVCVAGGAVVVVSTTLSFFRPFQVDHLLWVTMFCIGGSYAVAFVSRRSWLRSVVQLPGWIVIGTVSAGVVVGAVVAGRVWRPVTLIFLVAFVLFSFYLLFVPPLALYHSLQETEQHLEAPYPTLSILIPAYNEEGYIGDAIESVLESTYPSERFEVIVIDDGSTDGTYAEAAAYRDRGVKVFRRENGGKSSALNLGLRCSSGSVVVTVDADSRPKPAAIERMVAQLWAEPSVGALSAPVVPIRERSHINRLQRVEYAISNTNRRALSVFETIPVVPGCMGVYRREALEDIWGYDPDTITEDFDITVQLLKQGWAVRHGSGIVRTVVPGDWQSLWRQRLRWYRGSVETIAKHLDTLRIPEYRYLHALVMPRRVVAHLFSPIGSFVILAAVVWGFLTGPSTHLVALTGLCLLLMMLTSLFSLLLEDEALSPVVYSPLLFVGYKHFIDLTVTVGGVRAFLAEQRW